MTVAILLRAIDDPSVTGGVYDGHHVLDAPALVAIGLARQWKNSAGGGRLVGIGVGPAEWDTPLRTALALECDEVIRPWPGETGAASVIDVARAIAAAMPAGAHFLIAGDSSTDHGTGVLPAAVAECLGWPYVANVSAVAPTDGGAQAVTVRAGGGRRASYRVEGPFVASAARMPAPALYPRVAGLIAARRRAIPSPSAAVADGEGPAVRLVGFGPAKPSTRHLLQPSAGGNPAQRLRSLMSGGMSNRSGQTLGGAGPDIARQLTALLAKEGFIP